MATIGKVKGFIQIGIGVLMLGKYKRIIDSAKKAGDIQTERKVICDACHKWSDSMLDNFDVHLNIVNPEFIPEDGPVVYASNHQSYFDMFTFLSAIPHQIGFVAKKEWSRFPIFKGWIIRTHGIFIDRGNPRESLKAIEQGSEYLKEGYSMVIFPEGTRSKSGTLGNLKSGSYKLAIKAGVPIIPVTIDGSYRAYEEQQAFSTGQTINVIFHEPIPTANLSHEEISRIPIKIKEMMEYDLSISEK